MRVSTCVIIKRLGPKWSEKLGHRTRRELQYQALLFSRTWSGKPFDTGYKVGKEMSSQFGAAKSLKDDLHRRFERDGLQQDWSLTQKGSVDFMQALFEEAAPTLFNPAMSAAPPSKELSEIYNLVARAGETVLGLSHGGLSLSNEGNIDQLMKYVREHYSKIRDQARRDYGEKIADGLMRFLDR